MSGNYNKVGDGSCDISEQSPPSQSSSSNANARTNREGWGDADSEAHNLLDVDDGSNQRISFKRKQRAAPSLSLPDFLSPISGSRQSTPPPQRSSARYSHSRNSSSLNLPSSPVPGSPRGHRRMQSSKDASLDWYAEGPGRRVGYDDLTAIDWIFEYTKERQRLRLLYAKGAGLIGSLQQLLDASHVWLVLILTGIAAGLLAASINVVSDWLGDLRTGLCRHGDGGGKFWLNKAFCCWELKEWSQCKDWSSWSNLMGVGSGFGEYAIDFIVFIISSVVFAASASILVKKYAIYAQHSGIPEIKTVLGGFVIRRFMGSWTLIVKSLGLCLAVASGLWLGKEGPLVHVACCCANLSMKMFKNLNENEARKREVLSAAAAAGISVAFGSPIGGVLFSLEQLSYFFPDKTMWQSFVCAMVGAVTLQAFNPFRTGKLVLYQVTYTSGWHGFEIVPFAILGILGGIYGAAFINLNMRIAHWRKSAPLAARPVTEVILVAFFTALISFPNVFMRAQSSELVYSLFAECAAVSDDQFGLCDLASTKAGVGIICLLVVASLLGVFLASLTFGLQIPAGIILPSMAIGALYGRALGIFVQMIRNAFPASPIFTGCEPDPKVPCITPGTYAIIGAASALGGVTRMTVSIVVIMFELTGALTYVLPIMIAVMLSKWIGDAIGGRRGIYESWIRLNGYPFLENRDETTIPDIPISQIMTRIEDLVVLTSTGHTVETLRELLTTHPYRGFPVVSDTRQAILLGYISRTELAFAVSSSTVDSRHLSPTTETFFAHQPLADPRSTLDLRPWMDQTPITMSSKSSFQVTVGLFQKLGLRYVLFSEKGVLQGLMTKKDVWYVLNGAEESSWAEGIGVLRQAEAEEPELLNEESPNGRSHSPVLEQ